MTNIDSFNNIECERISSDCVNAFVDFKLDPDNPTGLCLDTSWGGDCLDLTSIVKAAETCTSLYLSPDPDPNCLVYEGECDTYCIDGDDFSRIISMQLLKDVDQSKPMMDGDVYMYNSTTGKFEPYDLKTFVGNTNTAITNLNAAINGILNRLGNLEQTVANHEQRIAAIEAKLTPPADAPSNVGVVFGNINVYGDYNYTGSNTLNKNWGLYTHLLSENRNNDEAFS